MAEFDAILRCTLGGSTFQLTGYTLSHAPVVEGGRKVAADLQVEAEGYVQAADPTSFAAALADVTTSLQGRRPDFAIYGLGGAAEVAIPAAICVDGGPYVAFEMLPQGDGAALVKRLRFTLKARAIGPSVGAGGDGNDPSQPVDAYTTRTTTRPDGLRQIGVRGNLRGPGTAAFFRDRVIPAFTAKFPPVFWVATYGFEGGEADDAATYTVDLAELKVPLPVAPDGQAVEGEVTQGVERDEQMRLVSTLAFNFVVSGDPIRLLTKMRQELGVVPLRERWQVTRHREVRITGEFQTLAGGNGNDLMNWERSLTVQESPGVAMDVRLTPGAAPVFLRRPRGGFVYVDTGRAVGYGRYPKPPRRIDNIETLGADDEVVFREPVAAERETTWKYTYLLAGPLNIDAAKLAQLSRPAEPEFL